VASIAQLRDRSEELFSQLLQAQATRGRARRQGLAARAVDQPFSWFDPEDAVRAAALSFRLAALAGSRKRVNDALERALDHVEDEAGTAHPEQVRQGFALFTTHNQDGRRLLKPRTVTAAPGLFNPPGKGKQSDKRRISIGGESPGLDYWREDALANEHHQHWHEVYPYTGLPPQRFDTWVAQTPKPQLVAILDALDPNPGWAAAVQSATTAQLAQKFAQVAGDQAVGDLPANLYRLLFHLNDRQGELFFYMHEQMLARYDAELLSNGLPRVTPFGPSAWTKPVKAGHDPIGLQDFSRREPDRTLPAEASSRLKSLHEEIKAAIAAKRLRKSPSGTVPIDPSNLGEAVEATVRQLRALDENSYPGLHNTGHVFLSRLSKPPRRGVMTSTVTAIRDQVFWQWHKFVDDMNAGWQDTLAPNTFGDAPKALVRNGLAQGSADAWKSPDIVLCRTADLPAGADPAQLGKQLFGGANWSKDFTKAPATAGATTLQTVDELITTLGSVSFGGQAVRFQTHEPFSYFLRIENTATKAIDVTVRLFLAPADRAHDRRAWMEMDKFGLRLSKGAKVVAYRPDTESSIVKRPAETDPTDAIAGGGGPDESSYCDCGWPYTLLLPRGTTQGMTFRLLALCTDAAIDQVAPAEHCGSMSYCGAVDRYPDARDMGYPFNRPFQGPTTTAIRDKLVALPGAAARTVTIRHA
jgi:hypothetical protein